MFHIFIHLPPQTCGLCYGQTPDPSLTCYDQIGEEQCRGLADKCFQYKGVCKKVRSWMLLRSISTLTTQTCGMCGSTTPHPSVSCYDEMPSECPRLAQTNCQRYGSQCKKVRSIITRRIVTYPILSELRAVSWHPGCDHPPLLLLRRPVAQLQD